MLKRNILIDIYKSAYFIRAVEELVAAQYREGFFRCPTHLSTGQELTPSVLSFFKNNSDLAVSSHRSHGHYLGKGGCLDSFFQELNGLPSGCSAGNGGSMHLNDNKVGFTGSTAIVGNTIPVGVGLAQSLKIENSKNFVYIFLGDGATEEGVFYESLHYSKLYSLPVLYIIENNNFSVYTKIEERQNISLGSRIDGFKVPFYFNDNNDYADLFSKIKEAIVRLRSGEGPIVFEIMTHRYREHCGPNYDDDLNYRDINFLSKWKELDILQILINDLSKLEVKSDFLELINKEIDQKVNSSFEKSRNLYLHEKSLIC